jgi:hypothetical protein
MRACARRLVKLTCAPRVQMTTEGIDRRCLDLMFDATSGQHRFTEGEFGERAAHRFAP